MPRFGERLHFQALPANVPKDCFNANVYVYVFLDNIKLSIMMLNWYTIELRLTFVRVYKVAQNKPGD